MVSQPRISPDAARHIQERYEEDPRVSASALLRELREMERRGEIDVAPVKSTVYRRLKELEKLDLTEPWRLDRKNGDEAALVLPVLRALLFFTRRQSLTRREAEWIVAIRRASPDFPSPMGCYLMARQYLMYEAAGKDSGPLDQVLAAIPWAKGSPTEFIELFSDDPELAALAQRVRDAEQSARAFRNIRRWSEYREQDSSAGES